MMMGSGERERRSYVASLLLFDEEESVFAASCKVLANIDFKEKCTNAGWEGVLCWQGTTEF